LNASKITAGSISADRIAANSLDIAGKGVVGSAGNITGTVGVDVTTLSNDTTTENTSTTWFASNPPHHYLGSYMTLVASATWTTPAFTGTRTYVVTGQGQPIGSFGGDEDTAAVLLVRQTSSATGFQSSSSSDFEVQNGIFNQGGNAPNPIVLAGSFSASGSLQYYAYLLMAIDDYGSGNKGIADASVLVYGLGA